MKKLSLLEMSEYVSALAALQRNLDGGLAGQSYIILEPSSTATLGQIAAALRWMSPYADSIRRMIVEAEKANG